MRASSAANADYRDLRRALRAAGCLDYAPAAAVCSLPLHVVAAGFLFWLSARAPGGVTGAALFLAASLAFYRIGWLMHDALHGGVFGDPRRDRPFGDLCAAVLGESPSGWRHQHRAHHVAPNVRGVDGDQSERFDDHRRFRSLVVAAPNLLLLARYRGVYLPKTLLLLGLRDLFLCHRHARRNFPRELALALCSAAVQLGWLCWLFGGLGAPLFFLHTMIGMVYLNTVFMGSHYDLPVRTPAEAAVLDFVTLQVTATRNYRTSALTRFFCGGVEHQIEHHLFPTLSRRGLRRAGPLVRAFCEERGLPYNELPFVRSVIAALRYHVDPRA